MARSANSWQSTMYNAAFAQSTIGSVKMRKLAESQVAFLDHVLGLEKGARLLDVPCGTGRHSFLFARKGYQVTGVDISSDCLAIARRQSKHPNARYRHGDMSKLEKFRGQYDAVLNLFSSFGYFSTDKENLAVLRQMKNALKPGGRLVLNLIDRDWILPIYQPARWTEDGGILHIEASRYDAKIKYNESHWTVLDVRGREPKLLHHHYHRIRLYSRPELMRMFKTCGFKKVQVYGDFAGNPYRKAHSTHPIYVASV